jgi:hypothetical protein
MRAAAAGAQVTISWNVGAPTYVNLNQATFFLTTSYTMYTFRATAPPAGGSYRLHLDFAARPCEVYVDAITTTVS